MQWCRLYEMYKDHPQSGAVCNTLTSFCNMASLSPFVPLFLSVTFSNRTLILVLDMNTSFETTDSILDAAVETVLINSLQFVYYFVLLPILHDILDTAYKIRIFEIIGFSFLTATWLSEYLVLFLFPGTETY